MGLSGPVVLSIANFSAAMSLQQYADATSFGTYAFAQILIALGLGVSNAVFGSPVTVAIARHNQDLQEISSSFAKACFLVCTFGAALVWALLHVSGVGPQEIWLITATALALWWRWFLRSLALAEKNMHPTIYSDYAYCIVFMMGLGFIHIQSTINLSNVLMMQLCASVAGIMGFGIRGLHLIGTAAHSSLDGFTTYLKKYGSWAFLGVVTTELMGNTQAYLITLFFGASSFAPIALASLFFRPTNVIASALTQSERPRLATHLNQASRMGFLSELRFFRIALFSTWFSNCALVSYLVLTFPSLIVGKGYNVQDCEIAMALVAVITLVRCFRIPESASLQADGKFKGLTSVTAVTAPLTVMLVIGALFFSPTLVSISLCAVLIGEILAVVLIKRQFRILQKELEEASLYNT